MQSRLLLQTNPCKTPCFYSCQFSFRMNDFCLLCFMSRVRRGSQRMGIIPIREWEGIGHDLHSLKCLLPFSVQYASWWTRGVPWVLIYRRTALHSHNATCSVLSKSKNVLPPQMPAGLHSHWPRLLWCWSTATSFTHVITTQALLQSSQCVVNKVQNTEYMTVTLPTLWLLSHLVVERLQRGIITLAVGHGHMMKGMQCSH